MALYQLVYRSKASTPFSQNDLLALLGKARNFNSERNITGILLYGYNHFIQLLEGDDEVVRDLYFNRIYRDPRHHSAKILQESFVPKRLFSQWAMGFRNFDPQRVQYLAGFIDPDGQSEFGRNLLAPLQITDALEMLSLDLKGKEQDD